MSIILMSDGWFSSTDKDGSYWTL